MAKYLNLLISQSIWFSRSDLLEDSFEGSTTRASKNEVANLNKLMMKGLPDVEKQLMEAADRETNFSHKTRTHTYLNSWRMGDEESEAMWRIYGKDYGIAIISSLSQIKASLLGEEEIFGGSITYANYDDVKLPWGNIFSPFLYKRKSFEHENEFRLLFWDSESSLGKNLNHQVDCGTLQAEAEIGKLLPVNLNSLITVVHVTPRAPNWYFESVQAITKQLGYSFEVTRSSEGVNAPLF